MNTSTQRDQSGAWPGWYAVILSLAGACTMVADQLIQPLLPWWGWIPVGVAGVFLTGLITVMQMNGGRVEGSGWLRVVLYRELCAIGLGVLCTLVDRAGGFTMPTILWWAGGTIALAAFGTVCPLPPFVERDQYAAAFRDRRPDYVQKWEMIIRSVTGWKTAQVSKWERWENPEEGFRLWVELPVDSGQTEGDLGGFCQRFAGSARLKAGCHVQALPSGIQGVAVLDVMEIDNLSKTDDVIHTEPTTPASINEKFTVMTNPRGNELKIGLRIDTAVIGGATGSGKTTLLHRIIMFLARCTNCEIWVADYNGGGLANPWIEPWARKKCLKPVVGWVATNELEFAVMTKVAEAISTARKSNPEVRRRMVKQVLPVTADLPAIIVIADEGGSIRNKLSPIGNLAMEGLTQIAQLGRAMGVRAVLSILRGTSDVADKGFRTQARTRIGLRMNEHGEYVHVLDVTPPKTPLKHTGSGYLRTSELDEPVYGRTVNVDEDAIERHAIACSDLRPELDAHALAVAARVTPRDVTGGTDKDWPEWTRSIQYLHCLQGKAYTGRWERAGALLAELRDEVYEPAPVETVAATEEAPVTESFANAPALSALAATYGGPAGPPAESVNVGQERPEGARIYNFPRPGFAPVAQPAADQGGGSGRHQILALISEAGSDGIRYTDIVEQTGVSKQRVTELLRGLIEGAQVGKNAEGLYVLSQYATAAV